MGNNRTGLLKTIEIDGGNYTPVAERIKHLAENFVYSVNTEAEFVEKLNAWKVKAVLTITEINDDNTVENINVYTGNAVEVIGSNDINSTSALENAETSAVGRACGFAGIGLTENIASSDEVKGAKESFKVVKTNATKRIGKKAEEVALAKLTGK